MNTKRNTLYTILLIVGIIILINIVSENWFVRLDFTADDRYTLSPATENLIENLNEPATIKAYFSENLPQSVAKVKADFKDLLEEYAAISDGMLAYEFIDPSENEETEMSAMQAGIQPILINVREKDQVKQQKAFLGATVEMGELQEAIPVLQPGAAMEYELSKALKKVSVTDKPVIGFLQGHGEPEIAALQQLQAELQVMYDLKPVDLSSESGELQKYKALAIVAPTDSFPNEHLKQLSTYVDNGGNLMLAINRVEGDLQTVQGLSITTGLETWLAEKGVQIENNFLIDANCGSVQVQQNNGSFTYSTRVEFPYLPIVKNFSEHPIAGGLEAMILQFASPVAYTGDTAVQFTPIAFSGKNSGVEPSSTRFNIQKQWTNNDFADENLTIAGALEGNIGGNTASKMVIIGDGDFVVNGKGRNAQQQQPDNINFFANAMDWLADDTGLISLRTKGVTARPLDDLEDGTKTTLKYMNFLLPLILIVLYGILRTQQRKHRRYKRMQPHYTK